MPMYYYPGMSGANMTTWMVIATLFWLGLAAVAVWALVRLSTRTPRGVVTPPNQLSAADILKARFARGEIDTPTFRDMMAQLTSYEEVPPSKEVQLSASGNTTPWSTTGTGIPTGML